jgi:hypothetical protein
MTAYMLAVEIAAHLGDGWTAEINAPDESSAKLIGTQDRILLVINGSHISRPADHGRVIIDAWLGDLLVHVPQGINGSPSITVAESKAPDKIANEIQRRLLPEYDFVMTAARTNKHTKEAVDVAWEQRAKNIEGRLGVHFQPRSIGFAYGSGEVGVYGRVAIGRGTEESIFTVHLRHDLVDDFSRTLQSFKDRCHHRMAKGGRRRQP